MVVIMRGIAVRSRCRRLPSRLGLITSTIVQVEDCELLFTLQCSSVAAVCDAGSRSAFRKLSMLLSGWAILTTNPTRTPARTLVPSPRACVNPQSGEGLPCPHCPKNHHTSRRCTNRWVFLFQVEGLGLPRREEALAEIPNHTQASLHREAL